MTMSGGVRLFIALFGFAFGYCVYLDAAQARHLKRVLIFGDSLTSGFNLSEEASFPEALRRHLARRGRGDALIMNTSRAGDDTAIGVDRIPLAFSRGADVVIVELGGNDMLGDTDPSVVYRNLQHIVSHSKRVGARVILTGMVSLPKRDPTYKPRFDAVYPTLAAREKVPLYPFFLDGVFGNPTRMQSDGEHPNAAGSDYIAGRIAPLVERELDAVDRRDHGYYGYAVRGR
jgi:acyl-CoA thioesterase-1